MIEQTDSDRQILEAARDTLGQWFVDEYTDVWSDGDQCYLRGTQRLRDGYLVEVMNQQRTKSKGKYIIRLTVERVD